MKLSRLLSAAFASLTALTSFAAGGNLRADVTLPAILSDHAVLQKSKATTIWGKAAPGEKVTVTLGGATQATTADADGKWAVALDLEGVGDGPFDLSVAGKNTLVAHDVIVGEVWVCSGQSNMERRLADTRDASAEIKQSANPKLRQFHLNNRFSTTPSDEFTGTWAVAGPETTAAFSAVGYYFAKTIIRETNQPVGLLYTNWGGTPIEAWMPQPALDQDPELMAASHKDQEYLAAFPQKSAEYQKQLADWSSKWKRGVTLPAVAKIPSPDSSWKSVTLPGSVLAAHGPATGTVWLSKKIELPANMVNQPFRVDLGVIKGFDEVYWNDKKVGETTAATGGVLGPRRLYLTGDLAKANNVLTIRVINPVESPAIDTTNTTFLVNTIPLAGEWKMKADSDLPAVSPEAKKDYPAAPPMPLGGLSIGSYLYNGMINPILPYTIKGVLWYQGEANVARAARYQRSFPLLIESWRKAWNQPNLPFYFCQLASFEEKKDAPGDSNWAELREAQFKTLSVPNTGMAVLLDVGESGDIHPRNKAPVGDRLAQIALANVYGKSVPFSGPLYKAMAVEGDKIRVTFDHTDGGLVAKPLAATYDVSSLYSKTAPLVAPVPDSPLQGFAICGEDQQWTWATAKIEGDAVLVSAPKVSKPVAVRYAWADDPTCNLYNGAGFPASSFRTDSFPPAPKKP